MDAPQLDYGHLATLVPSLGDAEKGEASPLISPHRLHLGWNGLAVTVVKRERPILNGLTGVARSGEMLAVMGPSGAGKSTFLDALCKRTAAQGKITFNGSTDYSTRDLISFVEQDDALLGVLTVRETVTFAARLALGPGYPHLAEHVSSTLRNLGLQDISNNRIGTPLQRGISGGQKRRVTIACSVVAKPPILVLDEPTSGLDSASGREVVSFLRRLAQEQNILVICTIHQPNFQTFSLFDRLLLLGGGQAMYDGPVAELDTYLASIGHPVPVHVNPADHAIDLVNTEFAENEDTAQALSRKMVESASRWKAEHPEDRLVSMAQHDQLPVLRAVGAASLATLRQTITLMHRNVLNYSRNLLAYGIRLGMYIGMALLLALVWIRLGWNSDKLNDRLSVSFFSVAFLGFMSVAGIPAFLEERAVFIRERANGLYGSGAYLLASTLVSIPFLFACSLVYTLIMYWAIGMNSGAVHFFRFLVYLFLALFAAESQSMLVAAAVPIFVAALALACFANGLWMCVQGYFIRARSLPRFWYYSFHFMDFQKYAFELLVRNDSDGKTMPCPVDADGSCLCPIASSLVPAQCAISGRDVLKDLGIDGVHDGLWVALLFVIIIVFRLAMWAVLVLRKK